MKENDRWLLAFLAWCAALAALLFCWIGLRSELAAWGALAWVGYGIWRLLEQQQRDDALAAREAERRSFPYTATEEQREHIKRLCNEIERRENWSLADWHDQFGSYPLNALEKISEADAALTHSLLSALNARLTDQRKSG